jgi:hypothetical protein
MELPEKVLGELEKKLEKTPGLGYVAVLASALLGIFLHPVAPDWSVALLALAVSFVAYWVGGFLDELLFEPIYGLRPQKNPFGGLVRRQFVTSIRWLRRSALAEGMRAARKKAAKTFHPTNQRGIYETAKKLLSNTELWDGRIKLWLDLSKTARTLIVPAASLLGWQLLSARTDGPAPAFLETHDEIAWLGNPIWTTLLLVISLVLYVRLRLLHMRTLYKKVAGLHAFRFSVPVLEPTADSRSAEVLWSVGERVISERELPVCPSASTESDRPL